MERPERDQLFEVDIPRVRANFNFLSGKEWFDDGRYDAELLQVAAALETDELETFMEIFNALMSNLTVTRERPFTSPGLVLAALEMVKKRRTSPSAARQSPEINDVRTVVGGATRSTNA